MLLLKAGKYTKKQTTRATDNSGTLWGVLNAQQGHGNAIGRKASRRSENAEKAMRRQKKKNAENCVYSIKLRYTIFIL